MNWLPFIIALYLVFSGCAMYEKDAPSDELQSITQDVLKRGEGVDIQVKPIIVPNK
jgi:hypothetical protein